MTLKEFAELIMLLHKLDVELDDDAGLEVLGKAFAKLSKEDQDTAKAICDVRVAETVWEGC